MMAEERTKVLSPTVEVLDSTTTIQLLGTSSSSSTASSAAAVDKLNSTTNLTLIGLTKEQQQHLQQALNHSINSTSNNYHHNHHNHNKTNKSNINNNNNNDNCIINKNSHNREKKFNEFIESCSVKTMNQCKRSKFCDAEYFMSTTTFGQQQSQHHQQSQHQPPQMINMIQPTIIKTDENGDGPISTSTTPSPISPPNLAEMRNTTMGFLHFCRYPESCLTLQDILKSFNAPISEEQAWALIFQTTKLFKNAWLMDNFNRRELRTTENIEYLSVHTDGTVHLNLNKKDEDNNDGSITTQRKILMKLAIIVYQAMDFNLPGDETCLITSELEQLISQMATEDADENEDCIHCTDEGIDEDDKLWEDESEDGKSIDTKELDFVLEACASRCKPSVPEDHYKAVCRALVTEALELRIFLQKVFTGDTVALRIKAETQTSEQELDKLGFSDWARFWIQVVDELRRGVRLKKLDSSRMPVEFELTPYEILMDDIRQRKYNLRKVMVNGDIPPRVKKDAHALILEFIRSRPPLKKASERKLPPPIKRTPSPREQLMDSIRQGQQLKPIQPCLKNRLLPPTSQQVEAIKKEEKSETYSSPRSKQRLIKVDFSLLQDDDDCFYENMPPSGSTSIASNNSSTSFCSQTKMPPYPMGYNNENNPNKINTVLRRTTYDLATQCESRRASMRRHTIVGCQSNFSETVSMPPSRPESRQSETNTSIDTTHNDDQFITNTPSTSIKQPQPHHHQAHNNLNKPNGSSNLSSIGTDWTTKNSIDDKQWSERIGDRLSLTLEEIVHIRSVMTKAELEGLPVGIRVKEDVERRKVCFLCLRTRFSIFGPWGIQCKLCQRTVCSKCYSKMRIPTEHFRNVPVVLLSPSLMSSPAGSSTPSPSHHANNSNTTSSASSILDDSFPKSLMDRLLRSESTRQTRNTVGSAPSSPKHQRSNIPTPANAAILANQQMAKSMLATTMNNSSNKENLLNGGSAINKNVSIMSRSMEGPRSLPVHSPARPHSNSSTLDRKSKFARAFTLSSSGHLGDQKENLRGELMAVCNDCRCLVLEIIRSSKQTRSSARNRALKNLTLDLSPVYKPF